MTGELRKLNVSEFNNACLVLNHHVYRLKSEITKIGRHFENDCVIDDLTVSRQRAEIRQLPPNGMGGLAQPGMHKPRPIAVWADRSLLPGFTGGRGIRTCP